MQAHLNIYVSKKSQWYNENFNLMSFEPWKHSLKILDSIVTPTPKVGVLLGVCGFIPSHSLILQECKYDFMVAFMTYTFPCPCFGHKLKARIVTYTSWLQIAKNINFNIWFHVKRKTCFPIF
jgi:hypothetical protein